MPLDDPLTIALAALGVAVTALLIWNLRLERRLRKLTRGKTAGSLEEIIRQLLEQVTKTDEMNEAIKNHLVKMEERLRRSIQHVKTVRFNPFPGEGLGGNQSFSIAFLDEQGNGAVLSALHARDKINVYAKPVNRRRSEYELSAEEATALKAE